MGTSQSWFFALAVAFAACAGWAIIHLLSKAAKFRREGGFVATPANLEATKRIALLASAGAAPGISSAVLEGVETARRLAGTDPEAARDFLITLTKSHPRSPALPAELAKLHRLLGDSERERQAVELALSLAIAGGMNPMAVRIWLDVPADARLPIELKDAIRLSLIRALRAYGAIQEAEALETQGAPK